MVSLDNGDPEIDSLDAEFDGDSFQVSGNVRLLRNCQDCGETLKDLNEDLQDTASLKGFTWTKEGKAFEPDLEQVKKELGEGSGSVEIETGDVEVIELGGGRFKKNFIEATIPYTITVQLDDDVEGTYNEEIKLANAASSYEECS